MWWIWRRCSEYGNSSSLCIENWHNSQPAYGVRGDYDAVAVRQTDYAKGRRCTGRLLDSVILSTTTERFVECHGDAHRHWCSVCCSLAEGRPAFCWQLN